MKKYITTTSLIVFVIAALADTETNSTYLKIVQSSNDVQSVVGALPDVEKLWPQDPRVYLKTVNQAAHILGTSHNEPDVKQALLNLFDSLMQKPCPTNESQIGPWVSAKARTAYFCFNFKEFQDDKTRWLEVAKFAGEVRSKIIPHYINKGMPINGFGLTPQEVAQNEKNIDEDGLQATLRQTDRLLIIPLLYNCRTRFPSNNPTNVDFVRQIISDAHLTDEESKSL